DQYVEPGVLQVPTRSSVVVIGDRDDVGSVALEHRDEAIGWQPGLRQAQDSAPQLIGKIAIQVVAVQIDAQALIERVLRRLLVEEVATLLLESAAKCSGRRFVGAAQHASTPRACPARSGAAGCASSLPSRGKRAMIMSFTIMRLMAL